MALALLGMASRSIRECYRRRKEYMASQPRTILIDEGMSRTRELPQRASAVLEGAASSFDPWAALFEGAVPWGQRFPGPGNTRLAFYARQYREALERTLEDAQREQPRLFDPDSIERS